MDGNLKETTVILLADILQKQQVMEDGTTYDESIDSLLEIIEAVLHEVHALGVEAGREGA